MRFEGFIKSIVVIGLLIILYGCAKQETIVALIDGNRTISLEELENEYKGGKKTEDLESIDMNVLKDHLDDLIGRELVTAAAYEMGLDKDSLIIARMKPFRNRTLMKKLHAIEIYNHVIPEKDIREYYANISKKVALRTIFLVLPRNAPQENEEAVTKRAKEILKKIRRGEKYEELAKTFSEDSTTASAGGFLGYVEWDRSEDLIKMKAWAMRKGQVSGLVRNNVGFHILKVDDIRQVERKPYQEAMPGIVSQLELERQQQLRKKSDDYIQKVFDMNGVKWNDEAIDSMLSCFKNVPSPTFPMLSDTLQSKPPEYMKTVLSTYHDGEVTIQQFFNHIQNISSRSGADARSVRLIIAQRIYMENMLVNRALQLGIDKQKKVAFQLTKTIELYMRDKFIKEEIYRDIEPTEEEILDFYESVKEEKYSEEEKVNIREIMVKDEKLAKEIILMAKKGQDFGLLAEKFTERRGYKKKKGELGYFRRGFWGAPGDKAFELRKGEIAGPITLENKSGFSIIKLLDRKPFRIKSFEEVKETVIKDMDKHIKQEREDEWVNNRRKKVQVIVYNDVLEKVFANE